MKFKFPTFAAIPLLVMSYGVLPISSSAAGAQVQPASVRSEATLTHYRTTKVDGVNIFYREAGPANAPVLVLLHGFPASSRMFRNLIPQLADRFHVIAPDYPGFGQSGTPDRKMFEYGFAHFAEVVDDL